MMKKEVVVEGTLGQRRIHARSTRRVRDGKTRLRWGRGIGGAVVVCDVH